MLLTLLVIREAAESISPAWIQALRSSFFDRIDSRSDPCAQPVSGSHYQKPPNRVPNFVCTNFVCRG